MNKKINKFNFSSVHSVPMGEDCFHPLKLNKDGKLNCSFGGTRGSEISVKFSHNALKQASPSKIKYLI